MRILIDLQGAQNASRQRGIGRYALALAKGIARNAGEHRVFVLLNARFSDTIAPLKREFAEWLADDRFVLFEPSGPVAALEPRNDWRRQANEALREHLVATLEPDIVLVTSMVEGSEDDTVASVGWLPMPVPVAAVLYDLIPLSDPAHYLADEGAAAWYHDKVQSLRRCDLLLGISQHTVAVGTRVLGLAADRVRYIGAAADESFSAAAVSAAAIDAIKRRLGIERAYVMHSSAFEARKNFQGLIRAYAALPPPVRTRHQLVLVCRLDGAGRTELQALAGRCGLQPGELVLAGFVPDAELVPLYAGCRLFVFPSFDEGFGLPPLEAMRCGAPAIGSSAASVPEVIGRADALFDPADTAAMTALLLRALTDAAFHDSLKAHAATQAAAFSWDHTASLALRALEEVVARFGRPVAPAGHASASRRACFEAVAGSPLAAVATESDRLALIAVVAAGERAVQRLRASAAFSGVLRWRIEGPFDSSYSLALLNRETARALAALGHTVELHSTEGPGDFAPDAGFLVRHPDLAAMHARAAAARGGSADVVSRNLFPPRVHGMAAPARLLHHFAWEESALPADWVQAFDAQLTAVTALSSHVEKVLIDSGVRASAGISGCGIDHWERIAAPSDRRWGGRGFRFLHVSSCFPRKGVDALLDAYGRAFTIDDDVTLLIKTFANPHNRVGEELAQHRARSPSYPHVLLIDEDLDDAALKGLYEHCEVLVAPSRAEGFGLPAAEAMLSGLPVIATACSGLRDFCTDDTAWLVDFDFAPARSHFDLADSVWAEPRIASLVDALHAAHEATAEDRRSRADAGRALLLEHFRWIDVAARLVAAAAVTGPLAVDPGPVGWITTWNTRCGIAAYSQRLLAAWPGRVTILAPRQPPLLPDSPNCLRAWNEGKSDNGFDALALQISQLGLQTLVLQFNYGFFDFRELARFLDGQIDVGRTVVVVMHSTTDPALTPGWNWRLLGLRDVLARCSRLLVHTVADLNRLKSLGLTDNVALFPHGALPATPAQRSAGGGGTGDTPPLVASYGFCLPHKGLLELVQAAALLRDAGRPLRLRLLNAGYPIDVSHDTASAVRRAIDQLALQELVELRSDYLSDDESLALLAEADAIAFPYQQTNESTSGAVHYGLASGRPVITTPIAVFDDLGSAVHRFPGIDACSLADGLAALLGDIKTQAPAVLKTAEAAERWRLSRAYPALSRRLHDMCTALRREAPALRWRFDGSSRRLRGDVGSLHGRSCRSTGHAGRVLDGPGLALPAGRYGVRVHGACRAGGVGAASLAVQADDAAPPLEQVSLTATTGGLLADVDFTLQAPCRNLRAVLTVDATSDLCVDWLEIRGDAGAAATTSSPLSRMPAPAPAASESALGH